MNDNTKAGADMMAGDGGYSIGTKEKYDEFVKMRNQPKLRIIKMVEQAFDTAEYPADQQYRIEPNFEFCKKFAELVVNECAEVAHCNFHVSGIELGKLMKEHFGVE